MSKRLLGWTTRCEPFTVGIDQTVDLCPADPSRVIVSISFAGSEPVSYVGISGLGSQEHTLYIETGKTLLITWAKHGPLVTGKMRISGAMAGLTGTVYEARYE